MRNVDQKDNSVCGNVHRQCLLSYRHLKNSVCAQVLLRIQEKMVRFSHSNRSGIDYDIAGVLGR